MKRRLLIIVAGLGALYLAVLWTVWRLFLPPGKGF